jgi:hypothetical protein
MLGVSLSETGHCVFTDLLAQTRATYIIFKSRRVYVSTDILSRVCGDYNRRGIGLTTGFIGSHTITVYTLYNSQQLSLFSSSEDFGSNCCNQLLWRPLPSLTHSLTVPVAALLYSPWTDHKENTSPIPLLLEWRHYRNGPQRKSRSLPLLRSLATVINNVSTVDCWPTACMSQYN